MSVESNGKSYEGDERPPAGEPDILLPKAECLLCHKWFTQLSRHACPFAVKTHEDRVLKLAKHIILTHLPEAQAEPYPDGRWTLRVSPRSGTLLGWSATERDLWVDEAISQANAMYGQYGRLADAGTMMGIVARSLQQYAKEDSKT